MLCEFNLIEKNEPNLDYIHLCTSVVIKYNF